MLFAMSDCFQQLEAIGKDAAISPVQQVIWLLKTIQAKNTDLIVSMSTVKTTSILVAGQPLQEGGQLPEQLFAW